jgi:hypothetical protein
MKSTRTFLQSSFAGALAHYTLLFLGVQVLVGMTGMAKGVEPIETGWRSERACGSVYMCQSL